MLTILVFPFQFKKYYEPDETINPPLCLDTCIVVEGSNVFLAEPLVRSQMACFNRVFDDAKSESVNLVY